MCAGSAVVRTAGRHVLREPGLRYRELARSIVDLLRTQPVLREVALTGGLLFGGFSSFWATLVFFLGAPFSSPATVSSGSSPALSSSTLAYRAGHVANQTCIYALIPEARSRLKTVFTVTYFIGGAIGSALGACGRGTSKGRVRE
jgi:hypothetical protein